jgi:hypothetical protein
MITPFFSKLFGDYSTANDPDVSSYAIDARVEFPMSNKIQLAFLTG